MLANCFFYMFLSGIASFVACLIACSITYYFQGPELAKALLVSYVFNWNGVIIGGVGYGILFFVKIHGRNMHALLSSILELPLDDQITVEYYSKKANSFAWMNLFAIPITLLGGLILWNCGYPHQGFAKGFLAASSISLYYIGGLMFGHFFYTMHLFKYLESKSNELKTNSSSHSLAFEALNSFIVIASTIGVIGLYLAFRGTLTADFTGLQPGSIMHKLLIFPIIIFLPVPLLYSFYPRFVLNRLFVTDILQRISEIELNRISNQHEEAPLKQKLEMEQILLDVKERLLLERNRLSVLTLKDSPSLVISLILVLQFVIPKDSVVSSFLKSIFG